MSDQLLPLIVEPEQLEAALGDERLVILHITKPERYAATKSLEFILIGLVETTNTKAQAEYPRTGSLGIDGVILSSDREGGVSQVDYGNRYFGVGIGRSDVHIQQTEDVL